MTRTGMSPYRSDTVEEALRRALAEACRQLGCLWEPRLSPEALEVLKAYPWSSDAELGAVLEDAVRNADAEIGPQHLSAEVLRHHPAPFFEVVFRAPATNAAAALGIPRARLVHLMTVLGAPRR